LCPNFIASTSPQHGLCFQSIIVRAQGEAQSAELIGESLRKNKGFLELRRLEAARDIATILSQSQNKVMLDSQSLLLNGEHFAVNITIHIQRFFFLEMQWLGTKPTIC
jgi:hypothetical protein